MNRRGRSRTSAPKNSTLATVDLQYMLGRMRFLHEVSQKISEKKPLAHLLTDIMESSKLVLEAEASSLLLYDEDDRKLSFQVATGEKGDLVKKFSIDLGVGVAGWVAKHRKAALIEDCYEDARFNPEYDRQSKFRTKSMICVPLVRKNHLLGVIQVLNKKNGGVFDHGDLTIFETLAAQCAIAIENARLIEIQVETEALERELEVARDIQQKLLPDELPQFNDIEVAAKLIPARQVGGDYYNVLPINDKETLFFVADVTGKGIPAALIVSTIYSCIQTFLDLNRDHFDLMTLVTSLNHVLIRSTTPDKFATCWFGLYNHAEKSLTSINAGHNPPYVLGNGTGPPRELTKGGLFLGVIDTHHESEQVSLQKGHVIVFFTDGVTEAWNNKQDEYDEERLIKVLTEYVTSSATQILAAIEQDVQRHVGGAQQSDDFTCAVVKIA